MKRVALLALAALLFGCGERLAQEQQRKAKFRVEELEPTINGQKTIRVARRQRGDHPQFLSVDVLPGRGFHIHQIRAFIPGRGEQDLLVSAPLEEAAKRMNGDTHGAASLDMGAPFLIPYADLIRGKLSKDGAFIETRAGDAGVKVPAIRRVPGPEGETFAFGGLLFGVAVERHRSESKDAYAGVQGWAGAADFHGNWTGQTWMGFRAEVYDDSVELHAEARNGSRDEYPLGAGWRPQFRVPSGNRAGVRLRIPAKKRVLNDAAGFPAGKVEDVKGTPYDFSRSGGAPLGQLALDECFFDLDRSGPDERPVAELIDPAARFGLRIIARSRDIRAFRVYAPADRPVVVIAPQTHLPDPFSKVWPKDLELGMKPLDDDWHRRAEVDVRLEVFRP